jgi:hypothetical protein
MRVTQKVKKILDWYEGDNPGRNTFQRLKEQAPEMLGKIIDNDVGKA